MNAKITPINNEPVKDEPRSNPVTEAVEIQPDVNQKKRTGTHSTWEKPTKDEMKQLNAAMAWKFIRLLLQTLAIIGYLSLLISLRNLDLPFSLETGLVFFGALPLIICYLEFRAPLKFGESYSPANDIKDKSLTGFGIGFCGLLLAPFFCIFAHFFALISCVLIAILVVLVYRKEYFMLILFVLRKYTVKDGEVTWRRKCRELYRTEQSVRGWSWTSLIYQLDFEDIEERNIPVLVDHYTYCRFKNNGKALLINYRYGESYMFEIVRLKDSSKNCLDNLNNSFL